MILLDSSGLLSVLDDTQRRHGEAVAAFFGAGLPRPLSPFIVAELDYLIATRVGQAAELALLDEVARVYRLEAFSEGDIAAARDVIRAFPDLEVGLADASLVVLAGRYPVAEVLTLDERRFRTLRGPGGAPSRLLPADNG